MRASPTGCKDKAAYTTTSLAASAQPRTSERIKIMTYLTRTDLTSEKPPLKPFPHHFGNRQSLIQTLECIGFKMPDAVTALAAAGQPLGSGGHRIDLHDLDLKLAEYDLQPVRRIQLKNELGRQGLLK